MHRYGAGAPIRFSASDDDRSKGKAAQTGGAPCPEARMKQRLKQVQIGKSTIGYENYRKCVSTEERIAGTHLDTPVVSVGANATTSKRDFEEQLRMWRRYLHTYDDINNLPAHAAMKKNMFMDTSSTTSNDSSEQQHDEMSFVPQEDQLCQPLPELEEGPMNFVDWCQWQGTDCYQYCDEMNYEPTYEEGCDYYDNSNSCMYMNDKAYVQAADFFPQDPDMLLPPAPVHEPESYTSLIQGTPMTNLEAMEASLIAIN
eukprot:TRINITY_DN2664_c1_g1_i1.p1 TRINITY_DN2664_c1_g1~~TRINITY_DN2664_c1_g1_i1.p1  ORF type:complete len:257 (+),score=72.09 TRINITY_DN2664_c1_g1_i1:67-837(+)